MADDLTITTRSGDKVLRAPEVSTGIYMPAQKVAPHMPTVVSGAQYNNTIGSGVFTMTVPSGATHALISVRTNDVHFTEDGSSPSSTNGIWLPAGFIGELAIPQALKFTRVSADAVLAITYRKYA